MTNYTFGKEFCDGDGEEPKIFFNTTFDKWLNHNFKYRDLSYHKDNDKGCNNTKIYTKTIEQCDAGNYYCSPDDKAIIHWSRNITVGIYLFRYCKGCNCIVREDFHIVSIS